MWSLRRKADVGDAKKLPRACFEQQEQARAGRPRIALLDDRFVKSLKAGQQSLRLAFRLCHFRLSIKSVPGHIA
jgi:hypothetical protein